MLDENFVSYEGFLEKSEFEGAVKRLAQNYVLEKKEEQNMEETNDDENMCRICYERVINSVFLECGHMVSCVECGRKLRDCPVCRQTISRVIHTFKA